MCRFSIRLVTAVALVLPLVACASAPEPTFLPSMPTAVVGTVVEFRMRASIVHFDHGSATFDHVVVRLTQPFEAQGAKVGLLYQGTPVAAGQPIRIGDRVSFTMPTADGSRGYPWGIHISELSDIRVLPAGT